MSPENYAEIIDAFPLPRRPRPHEAFLGMSNDEFVQQSEYFTAAFKEAQTIESAGKKRDGLVSEKILGVLSAVDALVKEIHPELRPQHFMPSFYQDRQAWRDLCNLRLSAEQDSDLQLLNMLRVDELHKIGKQCAAEATGLAMGRDVLNETPYFYQGDGVWGEKAHRACFNACFRMVFSAITDTFPHEAAVLNGVSNTHNNFIAHDDEFLKIFSTSLFQNTFPDKNVSVVTLKGTDLKTIKKLATGIKERQPQAGVFCIVNLESEVSSDIWHTNILLGCDEDEVMVHDPSDHSGQAFRALSKSNFHQRWAVAFNRAHVVIAA